MTLDARHSDPSQSPGAALEDLLRLCVASDASDLHLAPDHAPYLRIHGQLAPAEGQPPIDAMAIDRMATSLIAPRDLHDIHETGSLDGAVSGKDGARFRYNIFRRQGETSIAIRRLEDEFQTLAQLGLPESLYELCDLHDGLVLVAGPTGAGKSTTLATLIDRINQTRASHIVTIEDPIEYVHTTNKSLINQRQVGADASGFYEALVAALRQDPDVILVGEIRELNTIRTAITAAETGHLVFATVHAGDCVGSVERLVSVFPADEQDGIRRQLSLVLRAIVAQHLLVADGSAAERSSEDGRRPRVVASEVLRVNPAIANLIALGKSNQIYSSMESGSAFGMQTMEQDLARLWVEGQLSETAAAAVCRNPAVMRDRAAVMRRKTGGRAAGARA